MTDHTFNDAQSATAWPDVTDYTELRAYLADNITLFSHHKAALLRLVDAKIAAQPSAAPVAPELRALSLAAQRLDQQRCSAASEPAAWQWRYVSEPDWNTPSGGRKLTDEELKREHPIEQRPLYAGEPQTVPVQGGNNG